MKHSSFYISINISFRNDVFLVCANTSVCRCSLNLSQTLFNSPEFMKTNVNNVLSVDLTKKDTLKTKFKFIL